METLKRVLTVMVVTLVLIIVVGGLYTFGMGNMNHGKNVQMNMTAGQNQTQDGSKQNQTTGDSGTANNDNKMTNEQQTNSMDQQMAAANQQKTSTMNMQMGSSDQTSQDQSKDSKDSKDSNKAQQPNSQQQQNNQAPLPAGIPVIIQPSPEPKTDPRLYVEQLKEKVKEINDANSQIASNTGGGTMVMQPNGSSVSSGQSNMNELHQGFYKLGQNVSSMEQTLDNLSKSVQESNTGAPYYYAAPQAIQYPGQTPYYPYGYPNYYSPYNPYAPYTNNQVPGTQNQQYNQQGQTQTNQQQTQSGQTSDQTGSMNSNMQMNPNLNSNTQMNHSGLNISSLLNANNIKLVFSLILLVSVVLGIVAVVGFISSLFKPKKATTESALIE